MPRQTSFQTDILPLFTERDIDAMSKAFNLANYDDVKTHAAAIYDRIRGIGGAIMPPPPPRLHAIPMSSATLSTCASPILNAATSFGRRVARVLLPSLKSMRRKYAATGAIRMAT